MANTLTTIEKNSIYRLERPKSKRQLKKKANKKVLPWWVNVEVPRIPEHAVTDVEFCNKLINSVVSLTYNNLVKQSVDLGVLLGFRALTKKCSKRVDAKGYLTEIQVSKLTEAYNQLNTACLPTP